MTTPKEREEWMPSKEVGLAATLGSYNVPRIDREFHRTGLRAQIAVLEELPVRVLDDGKRAQLDTESEMWVRRKLAALREELAK